MKKRFAWCVAACALLAGSGPARASSALVGNVHATELRVAYASAAWTTVWTSLRIEEAGPFGVVVPLPDGAFVDQSTDAWFEALEVATAPRVFPPEGLSPHCPGESGPPDPFDVAASTAHTDSLSPESIAIADDTAAVAQWASAQGLSLAAPLQSALATAGAKRFLCVRFTSPGGTVTTPTLRVSSPIGLPALPFSITRAGASNVRVTAWFLGDGRATLDGTTPLEVPAGDVAWNAKNAVSDYVAVRDGLLAAQPDALALESAGHEALALKISIANGTASIEPVARTYFERASAYGNAPADPGACVVHAKDALGAAQIVSGACPRGDLASPAGTCSPAAPLPGQIDAADLACGPGADDLAIALSGAVSSAAWLTRRTFVIAQGGAGKDRSVSFADAELVQPIVEAGIVDVADCFGAGGAGGSTGTTTSTGGHGQGGDGSGASGFGAFGGDGSYGDGANGGDAYVYVDPGGCSCNGTVDTSDTAATASDDCSGDTGTAAGDDCSGDTGTTGGDDCSGETAGGGDACSGDTAGGGDACSGDTAGGEDCSGDAGAASDCAVSHRASAHRKVGPRLSVMMLAAFALVLPWRRRGTRKKRAR